MPEERKKNINNLPVIKETSLHRIVDRVRNNDNTLLKDPKTGKGVKTSDYLGVDVDGQGKVTKIYAKRPFYWECWNFEQDIERKNMSEQVEIAGGEKFEWVYEGEFYKGFIPRRVYKDFIPDDEREKNKGNPFVHYDFEINFSRIKIGSFENPNYYANDSKIYFLKNIKFEFAIFYGADEGQKHNSRPHDEALFNRAVFYGSADFNHAIFRRWASFDDVAFYCGVNFYHAIFDIDCGFRGATFSGEAIFDGAAFCGGAGMTISGVKMTGLKFGSEELFIDFSNCNIENKIIFGLSKDNANDYKNLTFGLYRSNINYFICNDKSLEHVRLRWAERLADDDHKKLEENSKNEEPFDFDDVKWRWEKPTEEDYKKLEKKTKIKCYVEELRVMRKIFQDLLWGDTADEYYAKIMDKQVELQEINYHNRTSSMNIFEKIKCKTKLILEKNIYKKFFGWGVRLQNVIITVSFLFFGFFLLYSVVWLNSIGWSLFWDKNTFLYIIENSLAYTFESFLTIDTAIKSGMPDWLEAVGIFEATIGVIVYTVFVAMLARKFMRM